MDVQKLLKKYFILIGPLSIMLLAATSSNQTEENAYILIFAMSLVWGYFLSYYFNTKEAFVTITLITLVMIVTSPLPLIYSLYAWLGITFSHILMRLLIIKCGKEPYSTLAKRGEAIDNFDH